MTVLLSGLLIAFILFIMVLVMVDAITMEFSKRELQTWEGFDNSNPHSHDM